VVVVVVVAVVVGGGVVVVVVVVVVVGGLFVVRLRMLWIQSLSLEDNFGLIGTTSL